MGLGSAGKGARARGGALASLVVHAILALAVWRIAPAAQVVAPAAPGLEVSIVRVPRRESPVAPAPSHAAPAVPAASVAAQPATTPRAPGHAARAPHTSAPAAAVASTATPAPASTTAEPAAGASSTRECAPGEGSFLVPIDPLSVAARALAEEAREPDAGVPGGDADGGAVAVVVGPRRSGRQQDLESALRGSVHGPDLSRRPPPPMRPTADGGYDVEGIRLSAHIAPDGRMTFQDGPPIEDVGPSFIPGNRESGTSGSAGVGFRFDLNDGIFQAAGEDPLRTERQFLLRETQALRDRLASRARRVDEERGLLALAESLRALAADRTLSPAARREAIFELWDDCATDAIGERARTLVEDFVRERFPAGTALAYTSAELTRLNRHRLTARAFDPYRSAGGAVDVPKAT